MKSLASPQDSEMYVSFHTLTCRTKPKASPDSDHLDCEDEAR
jgi:hypothetical protein